MNKFIMDQRSEQIARNAAFQSEELHRLREELNNLDDSIAKVEKAVVAQSNQVSAARAVVASRGGTVSEKSRSLRCTKRAKQRVWQKEDGSLVRYDRNAIPLPTVRLRPCGMVYTEFQKRFEAPRQSGLAHAADAEATVVLTNVEDEFHHRVRVGVKLWLLYWLDRNDGLWRLRVRPPRMQKDRVGVFASRSPNRPSPVGLSLCVVRAVRTVPKFPSLILTVSGVDILDESPLFAVRFYSSYDSHPSARCGWVDLRKDVRPLYYDASDDETNDEGMDNAPNAVCALPRAIASSVEDVKVQFEEAAMRKLLFIQTRTVVDVEELARVSLRRAFRAYALKCDSETLEERPLAKNFKNSHIEVGSLAIGAFRVTYQFILDKSMVIITDFVSGMRREVCEAEAEVDPEARLHLQFQQLCRLDGFRDMLYAE